MPEALPQHEGLRERKRREMYQNLTETGLKLFAEQGFEATTLDDIARAAGISRRTFFNYFSAKEEIILAWQNGLPDALYAEMLRRGKTATPFGLVSEALMAMTINMSPDIAMLIARITQSTEQLRLGNQMKFLRMEEAAHAALCVLWPEKERAQALKIAAMAGTGAMRIAVEAWLNEGCSRPLREYLESNISVLHSAAIHP
ncbi:TetR/AcrR family transcriptional regulator [Pantoea sp. PSNIH1]|uniref:TetR/AcrR family transcriptional regulator n=1 Tax=Pantoea sp. PSNIH1 TaxID=1484158 RepID=UPI002104FFAD|nr:TetR/AcrR family transcriptional regulator [Pantoea sp. PSNIH1]